MISMSCASRQERLTPRKSKIHRIIVQFLQQIARVPRIDRIIRPQRQISLVHPPLHLPLRLPLAKLRLRHAGISLAKVSPLQRVTDVHTLPNLCELQELCLRAKFEVLAKVERWR